MFVATLIRAGALRYDDVAAAVERLDVAGCSPGSPTWLDEGDAADIPFAQASNAARSAIEGAFDGVDVVVQPADGREKRLIVADMDSTMITVECIDELADYAGIKPQVAEITEAAMRGELDFTAALDARVALLKGLPADAIDRCRAERVRLMPGAQVLVRTMRARGATAILVSGGFTAFADPVGAEIGFDRVIANRLDLDGPALAGTVGRPFVDAATKLATLDAARGELGLDRHATLAVGDGANDLPMIRAAGLGVAYHAKPIVAAAAVARIDHGDLTALLWAQGVARCDWCEEGDAAAATD